MQILKMKGLEDIKEVIKEAVKEALYEKEDKAETKELENIKGIKEADWLLP